MKATVFIPTWFGEKYLDELLTSVFAQKVDFDYEVLIYDTSSTDNTLKIIERFARKHPNLRYKTIAKSEFGHGKTRQAAAEDARGEIVVYLSQDAIPADKHWLYEMVAPFGLNKKIVAVLGRQDPRRTAFPLLKYEIQATFRHLGPPTGVTLFYKDNFAKKRAVLDALAFYSDVNSAARRDILVNEIPYRDVPYAEDQFFGRDVIEAGYMKAYAPRGRVIHSNDMALSEYKHRMFDEIIGLRRVGFAIAPPSIRHIVKSVVLGSCKDAVRIILIDTHYSWLQKLYWLFMNPLYHIEKWRGVRLATKARLDDGVSHEKLSLEARKNIEN